MLTGEAFKEKILNNRKSKIKIVQNILDKCLLDTCKAYDCYIVANPMNEFSLDLIYNGAIPKSHSILGITEKEGVLAGYIIRKSSDPSCQIIKYIVGDKEIIFERKVDLISPLENGTQNRTSELLTALTSADGSFITSDLDILMICPKGAVNIDPMNHSFGMGDILSYEYEIASALNKKFSLELKLLNQKLDASEHGIVQHGPFNRFSKTKLEDIYFPLNVYGPCKEKKLIGSLKNRLNSIQEMFYLFSSIKQNGYQVDLPERWRIQTSTPKISRQRPLKK